MRRRGAAERAGDRHGIGGPGTGAQEHAVRRGQACCTGNDSQFRVLVGIPSDEFRPHGAGAVRKAARKLLHAINVLVRRYAQARKQAQGRRSHGSDV